MAFKIIVVDDEYAWRVVLKDLMEENGYQVDTVRSANEAVRKIRRKKYDLAIVDIRMPNENGKMDNDSGMKLCEELEMQKHPIPIIILSVRDDEALSKKCKKYFNIKKILTKNDSRKIILEINRYTASLK